MKIAILGANGFLGNELYTNLSTSSSYQVYGITKDNYNEFNYIEFDYFINANGNSRKYLAEKEPLWDFEKSVTSVYRTMLDFHFKKYIYISSIDILYDGVYGFHKQIAEDIVSRYLYENGISLRCFNIIGEKMKKGIVYDILNRQEVFLDPESKLRFITTGAIVKIIDNIISNRLDFIEYTLGSSDAITVKEISGILNKNVHYSRDTHHEDYSDSWPSPPYLSFKTAEEYIKDIL